MRSLSLGFGEKVQSKSRPYGEWEIGTYGCAWRVVKSGTVLCGSQDSADKIQDLNAALNLIELGQFVFLRQLTDLDVRVQFDNGVTVDFLATISDGDECFHIFCPEEIYVEFSVGGGWRIGKSNQPWKEA